MIIGVTGKSGSGKSTYAESIAKECNAVVVHVDEIGHQVLEESDVVDEIVKVFGSNVVDENSLVKRKVLGDLIFSNRHDYEKLTTVVWSKMKIKIDYIIKKNSVVILDWLLLPHTHYWKICNEKILVVAENDDIRKRKVMIRDNISSEYLQKREDASISYDNIIVDKVVVNKYDNNYHRR